VGLDSEVRFRVYRWGVITAESSMTVSLASTMANMPTAGSTLRIGALASRTGVSVEALRYYETRGLLRPATRRTSGYREYAAESVRLVLFVKRAQALGFSLAEVEELVRLRDRAWSGDAPRQLRAAAVTKVDDIDQRIRQLGAMRNALAELVDACDTACPVGPGPVGECDSPQPPTALPCPLIEALDPDGGASDSQLDRRNLTRHDSPTAVDTNTLPAPGRRATVRGRSPARKTSHNQRRNP
jgi:MerR family transcriptional regulator, copper efflux regulator